MAGNYRDLSPAVWNRDHLVVLWNRNYLEPGLTLSRFSPNGVRQGDSVEVPTGPNTGRFFLSAHDGSLGFIWSEDEGAGTVGYARRVYFQRAESCN